MNMYVSQEILAALGAALAALIVAALVLMQRGLRHLGSFASALSQHAEVNAAMAGQLKDVIEERRKDRQEWENERDTWARERKTLLARIADHEETNKTRLDNLTTEYIRLQAQLKAEREARERGEQNHTHQIELLQTRIVELERERDELRQERDALRVERDRLDQRVDELACEVDKLKKRDTGALGSYQTASAPDIAREQPETRDEHGDH